MHAAALLCSLFTKASYLIDDLDWTYAGTDTEVSPWYILNLHGPMTGIKRVDLTARGDADFNNVMVSLSNVARVGDPSAQVCAMDVSAAAYMTANIACPGTGSWRHVILQRYSNGARVRFGLGEVRVKRVGTRGCYSQRIMCLIQALRRLRQVTYATSFQRVCSGAARHAHRFCCSALLLSHLWGKAAVACRRVLAQH